MNGRKDAQMKKTIELEDNDWGQVIDGLCVRAEEYERTARYHDRRRQRLRTCVSASKEPCDWQTGSADGLIREVRDASEARNLANWYRRIVEEIRGQLRKS